VLENKVAELLNSEKVIAANYEIVVTLAADIAPLFPIAFIDIASVVLQN